MYKLADLYKDFPTEESCFNYILNKKYPNGCVCGGSYKRVKNRCSYYCNTCNKQVYPLKDTIFEKTTTPLQQWFFIIYLFSQSKHGVSAAEIQRHLGVTNKTAWRMGHKVRSLMKQPTKKLKGIIEADETYVGGLRRLNSWRRSKVPVMGMVERNGNVMAITTPDHTEYSIVPFIEKNVRKGSLLFTDGARVYRSVQGVKHDQVIHKKKEYARGIVHTCSIDGFWSSVKNSIRGTHKQVSKNHLQSYLNERVFSWNHRKGDAFVSLLQAL